ncbi:LysR family transcriptional regulator [Paenibacillus sp. strain BS8-2]
MVSNTEWYRIFLHAAEELNLTKAAQKLHMTQPSVSYAMKQLEETLGVALFERLSKGVRLTVEGQALYRHVRMAFEELGAAEQRIHNLKTMHEGQLRIGANGAIIRDYLLPTLDAFHDLYPHIRIQLSQDRSGSIVERLKQGVLDLGFVHLPVADEEIEVLNSRVSPYCAVVGTAFAKQASEPLTAEQLARLPLLLLSPGSSTRNFIEHWFRDQGAEAGADFELNSLEMLVEFAERGYGVAFLPRSFITSRLASGTLLELRTEVALPERHIGIAARKHGSLSIAADTFLRMLQI